MGLGEVGRRRMLFLFGTNWSFKSTTLVKIKSIQTMKGCHSPKGSHHNAEGEGASPPRGVGQREAKHKRTPTLKTHILFWLGTDIRSKCRRHQFLVSQPCCWKVSKKVALADNLEFSLSGIKIEEVKITFHNQSHTRALFSFHRTVCDMKINNTGKEVFLCFSRVSWDEVGQRVRSQTVFHTMPRLSLTLLCI